MVNTQVYDPSELCLIPVAIDGDGRIVPFTSPPRFEMQEDGTLLDSEGKVYRFDEDNTIVPVEEGRVQAAWQVQGGVLEAREYDAPVITEVKE